MAGSVVIGSRAATETASVPEASHALERHKSGLLFDDPRNSDPRPVDLRKSVLTLPKSAHFARFIEEEFHGDNSSFHRFG
jgi:hypothetical protein